MSLQHLTIQIYASEEQGTTESTDDKVGLKVEELLLFFLEFRIPDICIL
jgi:hypothetical protein